MESKSHTTCTKKRPNDEPVYTQPEEEKKNEYQRQRPLKENYVFDSVHKDHVLKIFAFYTEKEIN